MYFMQIVYKNTNYHVILINLFIIIKAVLKK